VKHDLEGSGVWTPSKLVETLNRHIASNKKQKKLLHKQLETNIG
jgi:hypothetical protein